jgi:outer membrane phospholipase A
MGQGFDKGYLQADFTIPTSLWSKHGAAFFHIQYWTGYGENLLDYNKSSDALRFGFSLVR